MRRLSALSFSFMPFCKQKDKHKKPYSPCNKTPCSCKPYIYYSPNQKRHCHIHHSFAIASAHLRLVISLSLTSPYNSSVTLIYRQKTKGNTTSSPTEKGDSPNVSVTLRTAPSQPSILIIPFTLPSSDVKSSSPFSLPVKLPSSSP